MDGLPDPVDFARDSWARAKAWARRQDPRDVALCAGAGLVGLGLGVAASPLGEGSRVTNTTHGECDQALVRLLAFLGAMVGGGVQRSPAQVGLNWVMSKGATPEVATRAATRAWECGGAMLWRLDENAVGIVDERAAAAAQGLENEGKAVGA